MGIISHEDGIIKLNHPDKDNDLFVAFSECPNPYCDCGDGLITISNTNKINSERSKMVLEINIHQKQIRLLDDLTEEWYNEHESTKLKYYLENNLTEEDWIEFSVEYYSRKYNLAEFNSEAHEFDYEFPVEHMNDESLLISFDTIYPASEIFTIEKDGIEYTIIEQYCKNHLCNCTDLVIEVYKVREYQFDFDYNYKTKKLKDSKFNWVIQKLKTKYGKLKVRFQLRNAKIRLLYSEKLLEKNQFELDNIKGSIASLPKVGRNDKCPCGSGKKYKQCCMNKLSF